MTPVTRPTWRTRSGSIMTSAMGASGAGFVQCTALVFKGSITSDGPEWTRLNAPTSTGTVLARRSRGSPTPTVASRPGRPPGPG